MRGEEMRAKNVAQKLAGSLGAGTPRDELVILVGLAELPRCAVEGLGNLLGVNHLAPVSCYWRLRRTLTIWREKIYKLQTWRNSLQIKSNSRAPSSRSRRSKFTRHLA